MTIKYPENYALGQSKVKAFPKVQYNKIKEIIDKVNDLDDGNLEIDNITPPSGTLTVDGNISIEGSITTTGSTILQDTTINTSKSLYVDGLFLLSGTPQTLTGAGAVNLTSKTTLLVTTGANALTLAAGSDGQIKIISMKTDGGDGTLTVTNPIGYTTITFNDIGDTVTLFYKDSKWRVLSNFGCTIA